MFGEVVEAASVENPNGEMAGFPWGARLRPPPLANVGLERAFQIPVRSRL